MCMCGIGVCHPLLSPLLSLKVNNHWMADTMSVYAGPILLGRENVLAWSCSRTTEKKPPGSRKY